MSRRPGYQYLRGLGITLIAADDPDTFTGTPTQVLIRPILGAVSQFQKAELAAARARKRASITTAQEQGMKSARRHRAQPAALGRPEPLEVIYRRIDALKRDPKNARRHSKKQIRQIAESIKAFGFNVPT